MHKSNSSALFRRQYSDRRQVRKASEQECSTLIEISHTILAQIDACQQRIQGIPFDYTDESPYLIAQFIQGIELAYSAILEGLYAQAASLQKQQIETLTALEELKNRRRKDGKTPNVQNNLPLFKEEYYNLNDVAHPSKEEPIVGLNRYIDGETSGPTIKPQYRDDICKTMISNHCAYLLYLWNYMAEYVCRVFSIETPESECEALRKAIDRLKQYKGT